MLENPAIYQKFNKRIINRNNSNLSNYGNSTFLLPKNSMKSISQINLNLTRQVSNDKYNPTKESTLSKNEIKDKLLNSSSVFNQSLMRKGSVSVKRLPAIDSKVQINRLEQEILEMSHEYNYTKCRNNEKKIIINKLRSTINSELTTLNSFSSTYYLEEKDMKDLKASINLASTSNQGKLCSKLFIQNLPL